MAERRRPPLQAQPSPLSRCRTLDRRLLGTTLMVHDELTRDIEALELRFEAAERENRKLRQDLRSQHREAQVLARRVEELEVRRRADQEASRKLSQDMERLQEDLLRQTKRLWNQRQQGEHKEIENKCLRDEIGRLKEQLDRTRASLLELERARDRLMSATQEHYADVEVWQQLSSAQSRLIKERDMRILELESGAGRGHGACCGAKATASPRS